jgi:hypothetical protein
MRQLLFANLTRKTLSATSTGDTFSFPVVSAGESMAISLRFLQQVETGLSEVFPSVRAVRASLGSIDARPEKGQFSLKVGTAVSSSGVNVTAPLTFNATAAQVKAALNALTGFAQDFDVSFDSGSYLVRKTSGSAIDLSVVDNSLLPISFGRVFAYQIDGDWIHEVRLVQAPLAHTDSFQRVLPKAPFITTVQDGYTDTSGKYTNAEIQKLTLPPDFRGTYQLRFGSVYRTEPLDLTDGVEEIQTALNAMLSKIGNGRSVSVTNPTSGEALIEFRGDEFLGVNLDQLDVFVSSSPPGDSTIELNLNTAEIWTALRHVAEIANLPLEIEIDLLEEGASGDNDLTADFRTIKIQSSLRLRRPVFFPGLGTVQNPDWLQNPSPKDYVPFTPGQVIFGQQNYTAVFGGAGTTYSFPHNLGTSALHVTVRENGGQNLRLPDNTYSASFPTANTATLIFGTAVAANSLAVTFTSAGPVSAFQAHTHTIAQVVGLEALLEQLGQRLDTVENLIGVPGSGATSSQTNATGSSLLLPTRAELLPPSKKVQGKEPNFRITLPPLPRAIYFGTAALNLGTATELPEASANSGKVYTLPDSQIYMPARSPRRGRLITSADAPFVLSDGYEWWLAEPKTTGSNIYYPVEMNRTLWELAVTPEMLPPGRKLNVAWDVFLAMLAERPELRGVYTLRVRKGTLTSETNFGTASNVESVAWDQAAGLEEVLFEQRISLTRSGVIHPFTLEIQRSAAGALSATRTVYGKSAAAPAPQNTQFVLRAELARFDLENYTNTMGRPVGQVYLQAGEADNEAAASIEKQFPSSGSSGAQLAMTATIS